MNPSIWEATAKDVRFESLDSDLTVDVAIVGGGITGVTAAALLARAGLSIALVEGQCIGRGTSGRSTGNLYTTVDQQLYALAEKWNEQVAQAVTQSRRAALDQIASLIAAHAIDCDYSVQSWHFFTETEDTDAEQTITKEQAALSRAGLDARLIDTLPLALPIHRGVRLDGQAQFHPLDYVVGLAAAVRSTNCRFFEGYPALEIDDEQRVVKTARGTLSAKKIIMATHTPKGFHPIQTELGPYSEHGVAASIDAPLPGGTYWSTARKKYSLRGFSRNGKHYVLAIGSKHKTGQAEDTLACHRSLEEYLRARFNITEITQRWTAQHFRPADGLPYIGPLRGSDDIYIATGFATDGLVYGTLAAMLICDAINGVSNPWAELYSARRFTPLKSAADLAKENANVALQYAKDFLHNLPEATLESIAPGEGKLIEYAGHKAAVCRKHNGEISALSALCTHLSCVVHWNSAEQTWDCPCHGSRFGTDGEVLEGPALQPLEKLPAG